MCFDSIHYYKLLFLRLGIIYKKAKTENDKTQIKGNEREYEEIDENRSELTEIEGNERN